MQPERKNAKPKPQVRPKKPPTDEEQLAMLASEGRLNPELQRLWKDVQWSQALDLQLALEAVEDNLRREILMGPAELVACTLWVAHTYVYECFSFTPRLFVTSSVWGSGKSALLDVVAEMACGGIPCNRTSAATLGRLRKTLGSAITVTFDQLDNSMDVKAPGTGTMLDILMSGAHRSKKQILLVQRNGDWEPEQFDLSFPMGLGKIDDLPSPALRSRCITIRMHPATKLQAKILKARSRGKADDNVRPMLKAVMRSCRDELGRVKVTFPDDLDLNRTADKWRPLLAIAQVAGGEWPKRALEAMVALESEEEERPAQFKLLRHVLEETKGWPHREIFSVELDARMERLGASKFGLQFNSIWRGKMLRKVGLKPANYLRGTEQKKGYLINDIRMQAEQYLKPIDYED
jgi:Protein of unknown function (DUF3631)